MLKLYDGKVGTREFAAILFFSMAIKGTDTTPDLLIFAGKNATWIISILSFLIILIPLSLLLIVIKKYNQGLMELIFTLTGKKVGVAIGFILFLIALSALIINSRSYADIINTMYYPQTPIPLLYLLLLASSFLVARFGLAAIGGTTWITAGVLSIISLILVLLILHESNFLHLYPIAGPGIQSLVQGGASYASIFGDIIIIAALFPYVRTYKDFRLASFIGLGASVAWVTLLLAMYTMVFNYPAVELINYPYHQIARMASVGGLSTHFESVFLGFWIVGSVLHFAIYLYLTVYLFARTFQIKTHERLLLPLIGLVFLLGLMPENIIVMNRYRIYLLQMYSVLLVLIPLLLWFISLVKGRKNHVRQSS